MKVVDLLRELRSFSASGVTDSDIEKFVNLKTSRHVNRKSSGIYLRKKGI